MTVFPAHIRALALLAAISGAVASGRPANAQSDQHDTRTLSLLTPSIDLEVGARTAYAAPTAFSTMLQSAQTGVRSAWDLPYVHVDAAYSLAFSSIRGTRNTRPLGLFRVSTRRGPVTFSLGLEQSIGVTSYKRAGSDTLAYHQSDTLPTAAMNSGDTLGSFQGSSPGSTLGSSTSASTPVSSTTNTIAGLVRASDIVGELGWNTSYTSLQFVTGIRTNESRPIPWTGVDATLYLGASNALTFSARRQPSSASVTTPTFALGFRSAYWHWGKHTPTTDVASHIALPSGTPTNVRVTTVGDSTHLDIYLPTAQHAAVIGDATDWTAVQMTRSNNGWWHIPLYILSMPSRIQLKTDKDTDWRPIPGLPATRDEYGGTVSLLTSESNR